MQGASAQGPAQYSTWDPRRFFQGENCRKKIIAAVVITLLAIVGVILWVLYSKNGAADKHMVADKTLTNNAIGEISAQPTNLRTLLVDSEQEWQNDLKEILGELDELRPQIASGEMPFDKINTLIDKIGKMTNSFPLLDQKNNSLREIIGSLEDFKSLYNKLSASDTYYNVTQIMVDYLDSIRSSVRGLLG